MEKQKEKALLICTFIGGVTDIIAIFSELKSWNIPVLFFIATQILFLCTIIHLYLKYKKCKEFLNYIVYLFDNPDHKFNVLPKICLALYNSNEYNNLHVNQLSINYTCDMTNIKLESLEKDTQINYLDTIEYCMNVKNKNLPKKFVCYIGNMNAKNGAKDIFQKYGIQDTYQKVPFLDTDKTSSDSKVQRYCWELRKKNITQGSSVPICFKLTYHEKAKANTSATIILYPRQYAIKIEKITFKINLICGKEILKSVKLFKIQKNGEKFEHIPVSDIDISEPNTASIDIEPDSTEYEAYYFIVDWELA